MTMSERLVPRQVESDRRVLQRRIRTTDRQVGLRIKVRREQMGWTQRELGEVLKITYQMVHKYERGISRVAAGRLHQMATALGVDVTWFYVGAPDPVMPPAASPLTVEFLDSAAKLDCAELAAVCALVRALAQREM